MYATLVEIVEETFSKSIEELDNDSMETKLDALKFAVEASSNNPDTYIWYGWSSAYSANGWFLSLIPEGGSDIWLGDFADSFEVIEGLDLWFSF